MMEEKQRLIIARCYVRIVIGTSLVNNSHRVGDKPALFNFISYSNIISKFYIKIN